MSSKIKLNKAPCENVEKTLKELFKKSDDNNKKIAQAYQERLEVLKELIETTEVVANQRGSFKADNL